MYSFYELQQIAIDSQAVMNDVRACQSIIGKVHALQSDKSIGLIKRAAATQIWLDENEQTSANNTDYYLLTDGLFSKRQVNSLQINELDSMLNLFTNTSYFIKLG